MRQLGKMVLLREAHSKIKFRWDKLTRCGFGSSPWKDRKGGGGMQGTLWFGLSTDLAVPVEMGAELVLLNWREGSSFCSSLGTTITGSRLPQRGDMISELTVPVSLEC